MGEIGQGGNTLDLDTVGGFIFGQMYKSIVQGTFVVGTGAGHAFEAWFYNSSNTLNDEIEYEVYCEAGSKTFELFGKTQNNLGIVTVYVDDVSWGTIDFYSAVQSLNTYHTLTGTVVGNKVHSVKIKVTSKNPASSAHYFGTTWLRLK